MMLSIYLCILLLLCLMLAVEFEFEFEFGFCVHVCCVMSESPTSSIIIYNMIMVHKKFRYHNLNVHIIYLSEGGVCASACWDHLIMSTLFHEHSTEKEI
jgi:hypothetical protein